ncbi:glycosyltransferase [Microbacterium sp. NPDC077663]|uniref:glycosyltransferase n=1 Tax=Microbacterium sp. NPDC077663 TaxID=3364189 RepID=UPI0037C5CC3B
MSTAPLVSIVVPLFNDEEHVAAALESCLRQTSGDFEVICVDDASTDATVTIVRGFCDRDSRVRLIEQTNNASAFQARRVGIQAARGRFILFLDGDDELAAEAVASSSNTAERTGADLVGIGVQIVTETSDFPARFQAALQPQFDELHGREIVPSLFPPGKPANGHLWRYLYRRHLLEAAYAGMPVDAKFYRANDLPIAFLAVAAAKDYVSTKELLYRYHFRRGTSGHAIQNVSHFDFLASGLQPFTEAEGEVLRVASTLDEPELLVDSYRSARRYLVGSLLRTSAAIDDRNLRRTCVDQLAELVGDQTLVESAVEFAPDTLPLLTARAAALPAPHREVKHVLLTTAHLGTGGLQGVLIEQAGALARRGYRVTVALTRDVEHEMELPAGVSRVVTGNARLPERLARWRELCTELEIDAILDHHILYNENWPWFVLMARSAGVPTHGWLHNFALRPVFDGTTRIEFLSKHLGSLANVVTLSATDVAFWKLRGLGNVVYLPNPLSRLAREALETPPTRSLAEGPIELVWWGRFDPSTKQVLHLIEVAERLRTRGVDFILTLIGPDSAALSNRSVLEYAKKRNVAERVRLVGDQTPSELLTVLSTAHLMVLTSAIEGSPLTLMEAQALGLPVIMYDLPWISSTQESPAIIPVPQDDRDAIAIEISKIATSPEHYAHLSESAVSFARQVAAVDIGALIVDLLDGKLSREFSPEPSVDDARLLLAWMVRFSERNARYMRRTRDARKDGDRLRRKIQQVENGASFRIGRAVTYIPRAVREFFTRQNPARRRRSA